MILINLLHILFLRPSSPMRFYLILFIFLIFIQTANGGWTKIDSKSLAWFQTISFTDDKKGFIGGTNGTLLTTNDGGETWKQSEKFTNDTIRKIYFTDENNGWLLCERDKFNLGANSPSYLLNTKDGGKSFGRVEFENIRRERIADIFFSKYGIGFAVGESGAIFSMQDDRTTWKKQAAPTRFLLVGGVFHNNSHAIIVGGGGNILFTEDSGFTWQNATLTGKPKSRFNSVFFLNEKTGWTVGTDGKIYQTVNGGKMWRDQKSGINTELNDIAFLDTREGFAIGADGTVLYSATAGNIWTTMNSGTTHRLEKLYFNGKKCWAVGYGGTILFYQKGTSSKDKPKLKVR